MKEASADTKITSQQVMQSCKLCCLVPLSLREKLVVAPSLPSRLSPFLPSLPTFHFRKDQTRQSPSHDTLVPEDLCNTRSLAQTIDHCGQKRNSTLPALILHDPASTLDISVGHQYQSFVAMHNDKCSFLGPNPELNHVWQYRMLSALRLYWRSSGALLLPA
jgi:hypothetical protein